MCALSSARERDFEPQSKSCYYRVDCVCGAFCNRISSTYERLLFQNRSLDPNELKEKAKSSA